MCSRCRSEWRSRSTREDADDAVARLWRRGAFWRRSGLYGVLAYQVSQRTREIGIRMALGSDRARILTLVLREGLVLVLVGLTIGFAGALALRTVIASQLYGVGPLDPSVLGMVTVVLGAASVVACLAPARRATRVDPVIALTQQ